MDDFKYGSGFQTARAYGHAELKRAKEAFVTGHSGTSMFEVSLVVTVVPVRAVAWASHAMLDLLHARSAAHPSLTDVLCCVVLQTRLPLCSIEY